MAFGGALAQRADWMLGVETTRELGMGGFHKFRFEEMRSLSLPFRRVRLFARGTSLSGARGSWNNGWSIFQERRRPRRLHCKGRNQILTLT